MSPEEAAAFLRQVAAAVESPQSVASPSGQELQDFRKLEIALKAHVGHYMVKMKVKGPAAAPASETAEGVPPAGEAAATAAPAEAPAKAPVATQKKPSEDYDDLKKRMKENFKIIFKDLNNGVLPSPAVVEIFLVDAEKMCTYPGKGDEYYEQFRKGCARFREAFEAGDFPACQSRCVDLNDMKTRCHADYK
jgi:XXXCH domain-containing protein